MIGKKEGRMKAIIDGAITTAISCGSVFTFATIQIGFGTGLLLAIIPFLAWIFFSWRLSIWEKE